MLEQIGEMDFWKVAMRPGAPQTFGTIGGTPFFGLPGNPTSTMVGFELFVRPAIRKMRGFTDARTARGDSARAVRGRQEEAGPPLLPARRASTVPTAVQGSPCYTARLSGRQSSAMLTAMHHANCLIALPEGESSVSAGSVVECIRLDMEEGTP